MRDKIKLIPVQYEAFNKQETHSVTKNNMKNNNSFDICVFIFLNLRLLILIFEYHIYFSRKRRILIFMVLSAGRGGRLVREGQQ